MKIWTCPKCGAEAPQEEWAYRRECGISYPYVWWATCPTCHEEFQGHGADPVYEVPAVDPWEVFTEKEA